jgi:hypothetical protein
VKRRRKEREQRKRKREKKRVRKRRRKKEYGGRVDHMKKKEKTQETYEEISVR